jgi:nucleoid DNA-binding protein
MSNKSKSLRKSDLVKKVSQINGLNQTDSENAVNTIMSAIKEVLSTGESVQIFGIGNVGIKKVNKGLQ